MMLPDDNKQASTTQQAGVMINVLWSGLKRNQPQCWSKSIFCLCSYCVALAIGEHFATYLNRMNWGKACNRRRPFYSVPTTSLGFNLAIYFMLLWE
mmetsp:Transcript_58058/g.173283  ORF Transcript_58058/g.173283 Transcript_58058/m.173283 type:complete len:96 (+) Transcript_58058:3003-3290(+)